MIYRAVFVRYLQSGLPDKDARLRAQAEVKGYLVGSVSSPVQPVRALSAGSVQAEQGTNGQSGNGVKATVRAYLADHPDAVQMSVNQLLSALNEQGIRAGRTTVAEVLHELRT